MRASLRRRASTAALTSVILLGFTASSAHATAPANDEISRARVITTVPSRVVVDTREATTNAATDTGGYPCMGGHSVWFRFRPSKTLTAHVITLGSDYDTMLGVFTGRPGALRAVACNDDTAVGSAVRVRFRAGTTYYLAVSSCCGPEGSDFGGRAVLRLYRPRTLSVTAPVRSARAGDVSGRALLAGTYRCSNPSVLGMSVTVSQRIGDRVARGSAQLTVICTATTRRWSLAIDSETGTAFRPRRAAVTVSQRVADGITEKSGSSTRIMTLANAVDASPAT